MSQPIPIIYNAASRPLRQLLGRDFRASAAITPQQMESCQLLIEKARRDFFDQSSPDVEMLQWLADEMLATHGPDDPVELAQQRLNQLHRQAGDHGFALVCWLCKQMMVVLTAELEPIKKMKIYQRLIWALMLAYEKQVVDDGRSIGLQLNEQAALHF